MPLIHVSVTQTGLDTANGTLLGDLNAGLAACSGPATIMVHGYKYHPGHPRHCPHRSLLAADAPNAGQHGLRWPQALGIERSRLGIAFGWPARGSIWQAHRAARTAGDALAALICRMRKQAPKRPINIVAHSLGARVALRALAESPDSYVDKMILLSAAEYQSTARAALSRPGGENCHVLNVTSRANDLFDFALERLVAPPERGDRMLGYGAPALRNLVSLQLDDGQSLWALAQMGFAVAPPGHRVCHWASYRRAGVFPLYRAVLAGEVTLAHLRTALPVPLTQRRPSLRQWRAAPPILPWRGGALR